VAPVDPVEALRAGEAFVDLSFWRKFAVTGSDAFEWLNDLVSADLSGLEPNQARRALLLTPTGRIRAEFTVTLQGGQDLLIVQDPAQPFAVDALLERYVLSSDVALEDRTPALALFAFPGRSEPPPEPVGPARDWTAPSAVGRGLDLHAPAERHDEVLGTLSTRFELAGNEDLERWHVVAGVPRFGVDASEDDLPEEGGFGSAVAYDKGCYLGQEAVARVRNLGHPRRVLAHVAADEPVSPGDPVLAAGAEVGRITSAADHAGRWWALATVRWDARDEALATALGAKLVAAREGARR
jgi:folate-binding protein YgfZ